MGDRHKRAAARDCAQASSYKEKRSQSGQLASQASQALPQPRKSLRGSVEITGPDVASSKFCDTTTKAPHKAVARAAACLL